MQENITRLLENSHTVAVVGLSDNPERASHEVAHYLQCAGYRVVAVNPVLAAKGAEVLGETVYPDLPTAAQALKEAGEHPIDIVDVFRKSEDVPPVADQAIAIGAPALWLQLGVHHPDAEHKAEAAGLTVVHDKCIKIELGHRGIVRHA